MVDLYTKIDPALYDAWYMENRPNPNPVSVYWTVYDLRNGVNHSIERDRDQPDSLAPHWGGYPWVLSVV